MTTRHTRREFLSSVGQGMLVAEVGAGLAGDLGLSRVWADDVPDRLTFGPLEPLVALLQETPVERLLPTLVCGCKTAPSCRPWSRPARWPMPGRSAAKIMSAFTP